MEQALFSFDYVTVLLMESKVEHLGLKMLEIEESILCAESLTQPAEAKA